MYDVNNNYVIINNNNNGCNLDTYMQLSYSYTIPRARCENENFMDRHFAEGDKRVNSNK